MSYQMDPEGTEAKTLHSFADFAGKSVLEIGCGEGRLTWQYADQANRVVAIDPEAEKIATAIMKRPKELENIVEFQESSLLDFKPSASASKFDVILLSWSLCCMAPEDMLPGLERAYDLLKSDGLMIDIHPFGIPEKLEIHAGRKILRAGNTKDKDNYKSYQQAQQTLDQVIESQHFVAEHECAMPLLSYYDSVAGFEEWIAENWNSTSIDGAAIEQARKLEKKAGPESKVVIREKVAFASLRPIAK